MDTWTKDMELFLIENYPNMGKQWCCDKMNLSEPSIRAKAASLKLKQNRNSEFFIDWQNRAKTSKIGKKRPEQSLVMKKNHTDGKMIFTEKRKEELSSVKKKWFSENLHPKGMLGKKHTEENKIKFSNNSKKMWENMSEEMKDAHSIRMSIAMSKSANMNRNKASWQCGHRKIGEVERYYRSAWEANYARYLDFLKEKGEILKWEHEPQTFWFEGIKRGVMSYLPDFRVTEKNGDIVFHEVKGWMDDRSKTKIKRMAKYHPKIKLIVIDAKAYKKLSSQISMVIQGWEFAKNGK